jgi:hypothetical protein
MSRFERLLIPIIAVVALAAFLLEDLSPESVRRVALGFGVLLAVVLLVGMVHRARRKRRTADEAARAAAADQTSKDPPGGSPQP